MNGDWYSVVVFSRGIIRASEKVRKGGESREMTTGNVNDEVHLM